MQQTGSKEYKIRNGWSNIGNNIKKHYFYNKIERTIRNVIIWKQEEWTTNIMKTKYKDSQH